MRRISARVPVGQKRCMGSLDGKLEPVIQNLRDLKPFAVERGDGIVERSLNAMGKLYYQTVHPFNFSQHAESKTLWDLDHISSGNEATTTENAQAHLFDKLCKFWTVEGLPGAGKAAYTSEIAEGLGLKDMGTSCLWWEHRRLKEFKGQPGLHHTWDVLIKDHHHFLAMRDVYMQKFFENPKDMVHSCRLQDHMKLQRHIHSMDSLFHLLTTAEGTIANRTFHSDYCFAYAMMKMGYLSKNYYEMRYCVSQATVDGHGGASDFTPNVSFLLDISPEESFESIKKRGNEAEIATCNLEFLRHLHDAYQGFWAEDMHNKGCTVIKVNPSKTTGEDLVDLVHEMDEDELHHPYSRWSYSHEKQYPGNNISTYMGQHHAYFDHETHLEHARAGRSEIPFTKLLFMGGNEYEKCLQRDLSKGPKYSYDINYSFHPWDDLSESNSYKENQIMMSFPDESQAMDDIGKVPHEQMRNELKPITYHPDWTPPSADWFGSGKTTSYTKIIFGSHKRYIGNEYIQHNAGLTL